MRPRRVLSASARGYLGIERPWLMATRPQIHTRYDRVISAWTGATAFAPVRSEGVVEEDQHLSASDQSPEGWQHGGADAASTHGNERLERLVDGQGLAIGAWRRKRVQRVGGAEDPAT